MHPSSIWLGTGEIAAQRRHSPLAAGLAPPPAACKRSGPLDQDPAPLIQTRRHCLTRNHQRPSDLNPTDLDQADSGQPQTQPTLAILQKTPYVFWNLQKYPPTLGSFLRFSSFSLF
jgi:hypothetical protein